MRSVISTAAIVMVASLVEVDRVSFSPLALALARTESGGQDRVAGILAATKQAMGGEDKVAALKGLTAEGPFRRAMGGRDMEGVVTLTIERPDKMRRVEEMQLGGMVGGPTIENVSVLTGNTSWQDSQNRGGMGGGMRIMINQGPGPGGPGGSAMTPEQIDEARTRRMKVDFYRMTAVLLADAGTPWVDAGIAESPEGKADILETKEGTGRTLRLFIDQGTKLPLMVHDQDPKPRIMINSGGPGGPGRGRGGPGSGPDGPRMRGGRGAPGAGDSPPITPEQIKERIAEMQRTPPEMGTYAMHLSDFKKVDGIMLPHKIETSLDGEPNQEWTIEKYKVNPQIKPDVWQKK